MVVAGEPWMIPALSRIWEICFGDSPEYIRFFMERRFPTCQSFVWLEQGEPVGVVYLLPSLLQGKQSFYSYAGGVLPEYRNRGIFRKIFHFFKMSQISFNKNFLEASKKVEVFHLLFDKYRQNQRINGIMLL